MNLCASFDTSFVHTDQGFFHNLEFTQHAQRLKTDYALLRKHGFNLFRDSVYLTHTFLGGEIKWDYIDALAKAGNGQTMLSFCHYEMPYMPDGTVKDMDRYMKFVYEVARRYKGAFTSYLPVVESGYWCQKLTEDWLPHFPNWWTAFDHVSDITLLSAQMVKEADSTAKVAMCEPIYWRDMKDNTRPFDTLLGVKDPIAVDNDCHSWQFGKDNLLDIIGLNLYSGTDTKGLIQQLEALYPAKEICITETNNNHSGFTAPEYITRLEIRTQDTRCQDIYWNPIFPMRRFEDGLPIGGGYLFDLQRKKVY